MPFEFGDVVLAPVPFTNQMTSKQRPAVVISRRGYAQQRPDIILMAITSQIRAQGFADSLVKDWQAANLLKPSVVKPALATLEQGLVIKQLGVLSAKDQVALKASIQLIIAT